MKNTITKTNFKFKNQTNFYKGKVRDVYNIGEKKLVMIVSDRVSAFDVVLPEGIPYKGQVLNEISYYFMKNTTDIVPNWITEIPNPVVSIGKLCVPYKIEIVVRGYLSGHAWREYKEGKRKLCGVNIENGLKENDKLEKPIITPTTKEENAHDEDISKEEIISRGLISLNEYEKIESYALSLFQRGTEMALKRGLILVDTKYEFGNYNGEIYLMDEIHTPDSSRYFYNEGYNERQKNGEKQKQLSKEFLREWLMENGFQGKEGEIIPEMSDSIIEGISERYIELYENITGEKFIKKENSLDKIEKDINEIKENANQEIIDIMNEFPKTDITEEEIQSEIKDYRREKRENLKK